MTPFKIQDLGSLPGFSAVTPNSINHTGNIVGTMMDVTLNTQSFFWNKLNGLEKLPLIPDASYSSAQDLNDHDEIVGYCVTLNAPYPSSALIPTIWKSGVAKRIDPESQGIANSINNSGEIAGVNYDFTNINPERACKWENGVINLLEIATYKDSPLTINDGGFAILSNGDVYGNVLPSEHTPVSFYETAARWDSLGLIHQLDLPDNLDLNGILGRLSMLRAANDSGNSVGIIFAGGHGNFIDTSQAYYWGTAEKNFLGTYPDTLKGDAYDINEMGQIVGWLESGTGRRATIWNGPIVTDLNDLISPFSEWVLTEARCINSNGSIAGIGYFFGEPRAWVMVPVYKTVVIPPIYWHIIFGFLGDTGGVHIVGPGGGDPSPIEDTLSSVLHHIPQELRADVRNILISGKNIQREGLNRK